MSLTRKLLKELELTDAAIERVISAHTATVDALKQEHKAALAEAESASAQQLDAARRETVAAQEELEAHRAQVEAERHREARRTALSEALETRGANPAAIPLMLDAVTLPEEAWNGDVLTDADAALQPIMAQYGALFARRTPMPVMKVQPPVLSGGGITRADVSRMSQEDINRNWSAVRTALQNNR